MRATCLLLVALFTAPARLPAQSLVPRQFAPAPTLAIHACAAAFGSSATADLEARATRAEGSVADESVDVPKLALGGILGGTAGMFAGALVGARFERSPCEDCFWAALTGALIGESIGSAFGVHLANGRQGPALAEMAVSLGVGLLGFRAAAASGSGAFLLAIPVTQIAGAIWLEHEAEGGD